MFTHKQNKPVPRPTNGIAIVPFGVHSSALGTEAAAVGMETAAVGTEAAELIAENAQCIANHHETMREALAENCNTGITAIIAGSR